ncbi:unnamed protein product [Owenia fusiformis]|uniref:Uncharacterized protein n=1 Tax=Owenia fusiformis TaxID=6347 RepID=A0A8J1Y6C1_OWEFU|nr:unnamed protein product [Owenia fusiformis]
MAHFCSKIFAITVVCISYCKCRSTIVDMTYDLFNGLPQWPGSLRYKLTVVQEGPFRDNTFAAQNGLEMTEHTGTHIDAPYHNNKSAWKVNEIPLDRLIGPAVVLDIREKVENTPPGQDATVDITDAMIWEEKYGEIPNGAIVIMHSGYGKKWPNATAFLGTDNIHDVTTLRFPGFGPQLAEWLVKERNIIGIGVDTASTDPGSVYLYYTVHNIISAQNVWGLENIANIDRIPVYGAKMFVMPLRIRGGTGSPVRAYAKWNPKKLALKEQLRLRQTTESVN